MQLLRLQQPHPVLPEARQPIVRQPDLRKPELREPDVRQPDVRQPDVALGEPCRCGHISVAHEHYRRGSDCALCGCGRYQVARARHGVFGALVAVARERSRRA
jgi:hypothetical protein